MGRHLWRVIDLKEIGQSESLVRELIKAGYYKPQGWHEMSDEKKHKALADMDKILIYDHEILAVIAESGEHFLGIHAVLKAVESIKSEMHLIRSEIASIKNIYEVSTTPLLVDEIISELSKGDKKITKGHVYNSIVKDKNNSMLGYLQIPKKHPVLNVPGKKNGREWEFDRLEFFNQLNSRSYDQRRTITAKLKT